VGASNATDLTVSFDYKIVNYSGGATVATPAGWGSAELQYSTDDGGTWATVLTIDDSNHVVGNTCLSMTATVPAASLPSGSDVKLQILNTLASGDYYFYVDNFVAAQVASNAPDCPLNVSDAADASCGNFNIPITWDASTGALGYKISVGTSAGATDVENLTDLGSALTYTIAAPTAGTTYYYTVVAYNSVGDSAACTENTVTAAATGCYCDSMPTSNDGNGIGNLQVATTDFASGGDLTYEDFTGAPVDLGQGINSNVQITFETGYGYGVNIWIDLNDDLTFDSSENVYALDGETSNANPTTHDASFVMPATAALGTHRMRIVTDDSEADATDPCNSSSWGVTIDVDVNIIAVSCTEPTGTATLVTDCDNNQYFVDVDVTGLGDGTSVINDGTTTYPATTTGVVQVGPYADASSVTIVLENGTDSACDTPLGTFTNTCPIAGQICETAIDVSTLPYNTSDDTANYFDEYTGSPGTTDCGTTSSYLNGDDVIYSYTATADASLNIALSSIGSTYSGMFVYTDCADIGTACIAGHGNGSSTADYDFDISVTNGTTYYIVISTWASPQSTTYTLDITENTCTAATATYAVVADCAASGSGGFNITVDITDMGTAASLTVSDDQGSANQPATTTGMLTFGPYVNATDVVITIADDSDVGCTLTSATLTQEACPPANDDCANAEVLIPSTTGAEVWVTGTTIGNTASGEVTTAGCGSFGSGRDVWYSVEVPALGDITITTQASEGSSLTDTTISVYSGTCGVMGIQIECDDDGGTGNFSEIVLTGQTAGAILYVRVQEYGAAASRVFGPQDGPFEIAAHAANPTLSTTSFDNELAFSYYPNPVNNTLTLNAQKEITNVSVYNMLGQQVIRTAPNAVSNEVNMSSLQSGAYFVKVTISGATETIRIIKN
jgi:hypothetical protein